MGPKVADVIYVEEGPHRLAQRHRPPGAGLRCLIVKPRAMDRPGEFVAVLGGARSGESRGTGAARATPSTTYESCCSADANGSEPPTRAARPPWPVPKVTSYDEIVGTWVAKEH